MHWQDKYQLLVDMDRIHEIFGDDHESIQEFLKTYIDFTTQTLANIKIALKNKDMKLIKDLFHRLKGSSGSSGIIQIYELSLAVEEKIQKEDWEAINTLFQDIHRAFEELQELCLEKT